MSRVFLSPTPPFPPEALVNDTKLVGGSEWTRVSMDVQRREAEWLVEFIWIVDSTLSGKDGGRFRFPVEERPNE